MARALVKTISRGKKNLVMNGDMKVNQRQLIVTGTASPLYVVDRFTGWFTDVASVTSPVMEQTSLPAGFPGETDTDTAIERGFRMRGTVNSLAPAPTFNRSQRIESIYLRDNIKPISNISTGAWVYGNNFTDVTVQVLQATGAGSKDDWSSSTVVDTVTIPINEDEWKFVTLENVVLPTNHGIEIRITFEGAIGTVFSDTYVTEVMVNSGPTVEAFSLFGEGTFEDELLYCKRYFEKSHRYEVNINAGHPPTWNSGIGKHILEHGTHVPTGLERWIADVQFEIEKRVIPTITIRDRAGSVDRVTLVNSTGGGDQVGNTFNTTAATQSGFAIRSDAANTYALAGASGFACTWVADAEL